MVRPQSLDLEVSVSPIAAVRALRTVIQEAGWTMRRHEGARMVDRFAIIMPMTQATRTIGLEILDGPLHGGLITAWSETRGSTGEVHQISWLLPGGTDSGLGLDLIHAWANALPRIPWKWTFGERSTVGFLLPTWRKSKRAFDGLGFDVGSKAWPRENHRTWPPEDEEA
ncbi:MAG: hypothetical protein L7U48_00285 [Candidatus Poseidoniaceae archaeon]|jgi:hypothetical protein|nr:hypothetical protein [Candidatus Poseidoniaceae archaeon]